MTRVASAVLLAVLIGPTHADDRAAVPKFDDPWIAFESPFGQSSEKHASQWKELSPQKRKAITNFLIGRLGLSSTGRIQLIGVYRDTSKKQPNQEKGIILHFRQLDLNGSRLVWSVLVDPEASSAQVLYDANAKPVAGKPIHFAAPVQKQEE